MVESVGQNQVQPFTTIKYTTKDGENISATKKDGVVTLVGDKNGVRQMPLEDFKKELLANLPQTQLEKTPDKDTVDISKKSIQTESKVALQAEKTETSVNPVTQVAEQGKKLDVAA